MTPQQLLGQAFREHQNGQFDRAERLYRELLGKNPTQPDALNLLGMLLGQKAQFEEAVELMQRAVAIAPTFAPFHANLGETYRRLKMYDDAVASLKRAIELDPRMLEVHNNLSSALAALKRWEEAEGAARKAVELQPNYAAAHFNLGVALEELERYEEAVAAYRRALEILPGDVDSLTRLGSTFQKSGKFDEAIDAFLQAVRAKPDLSEGHNNLAVALESRGRMEEALAEYAEAVRLNAKNMRAQSNYGNALTRVGRLEEALTACEAAVALADVNGDAYVHLGAVYRLKADLDEARRWTSRAIEIEPGLARAHNAMANILKDMGDIKEAIAGFKRAEELGGEAPGFGSNAIYTLYFDPDCSEAELLKEHRAWAAKYAEPLRTSIRPFGNNRDPDRRLKIGYVSPDFRAHPVGRFIAPLLAAHDHGNFQIYCYASVTKPDFYTPRLQQFPDVWRDATALTNEELAEMIRADGIDVLVDLTMHMAENRMEVFSRKPAPIQMTYLAYAGTTGVETIDYRITDPWLDPAGGSQEFYTEESVRIASYWCYEAPIENLPKTPLPLLSNGFVTFGCLNNFCKISLGTLEAWCRILAEVPGSRLTVHAEKGSHRGRMLEKVAARGIEAGRVNFVEKLSLPAYMEQYGKIDIGLDPFPYVGGTTTCDALWMGVPVVTLRGDTAISRGGVSIMNNMGVPELIADSTDDYVRIAVDLAKDRARLEQLRQTLRQQMEGSRLMDAKRFAREMEDAYRGMWRAYVSGGS